MPCLVLFLYVRYRAYKYRGRGLVVEYDIDERSVERDDLHFVEFYRRFFVDCNRCDRSRFCPAFADFDMRFVQNFVYIKIISVAAISEFRKVGFR